MSPMDWDHKCVRGAATRHGISLLGEELLAEIFSLLAFEERLQIIPLVCKGWRAAVSSPACWRRVNMWPWFRTKSEDDLTWEFSPGCEREMDFLVRRVVDLSAGQLRELRTTHCSDLPLDYISQNCPSLTSLFIPDSVFITDQSVIKLVKNCPKLEKLDLSDCYDISSEGLENLGRNCPSLVWLARNMVRKNDFVGRSCRSSGDEEAKAVGENMPKLKHLEMKRSTMSDIGLACIARGCRNLERLNLASCTSLSALGVKQVVKMCPHLKFFTKPLAPKVKVNPNLVRIFVLYN